MEKQHKKHCLSSAFSVFTLTSDTSFEQCHREDTGDRPWGPEHNREGKEREKKMVNLLPAASERMAQIKMFLLTFFLFLIYIVLFCIFFQSIIFIRDRNSRGQEVSAYIDYAHRLKTDEFEVYFNGKKKLLPRHTDLSFYNWDRNISTSNSSPNYQVIAENACGLLFKNKCDRKIINVDPKAYPGDNTTRTPIETDLYLQVVIYDHVLRRKI
uniref:Cilia- and flagella-associated protein 299 n=1 Tax=Crocodylus porosus TaxID=8502 RepID=A0A7M4FVH4_CROPO